MTPPIDIYPEGLMRSFGGRSGQSTPVPPPTDPWLWPDAIWTMDTRGAVNAAGFVSLVPDLVFPLNWTSPTSGVRYAYAAGPPAQAQTPNSVNANLQFVDTVGTHPCADYCTAPSWTVCVRAFVRWASIPTGTENYLIAINGASPRDVRVGREVGTTQYYFRLMQGTNSRQYNLGTSPRPDQWETFAFRAAFTVGTLADGWLNGVQVIAPTAIGTVVPAATTLQHGCYGWVANIEAYGATSGYARALTDAEMADWHTYYAAVFA